MSLLYIDSCGDHYNTATAAYKWTASSWTVQPGLHGNGLTGNGIMGLDPIPTSTRAVVGLAVRMNTSSVAFLVEIAAGNGWQHFTMSKPSGLQDGSIQMNWAGSGTAEYSAPNVIHFGESWNYIELDGVVASGTGGSVAVRVNGVVVASVSGVNTLNANGNTPDPFWNNVRITCNGGTIDDLYILDGTDADTGLDPGDPRHFNAPLGAVEVDVIFPNGAGAATDWTPEPGSNANWENVAEPVPDDDATYNHTTTLNDQDLFEMEDISTGDGVLACQLLVCAKRTAEGFEGLSPLLRQATTIYAGTERSLAANYLYQNREVYEFAPDDTIWTDAKVNAIQAGYEKTS